MKGSPVLDEWLAGRSADWLQSDEQLNRLNHARQVPVDEALRAVQAYRRLGRDWTLAKQLGAPPGTTAYLSRLYASLHQLIYKKPARIRTDLAALLRYAVPRAIRNLGGQVAFVCLLFALAACAGAWLVSTYPKLIGLVASPAMIDTVERGELWTDNLLNVMPSSMLAVSIFTNNITVSLFACCIGAFYGIGTVYIIGLNGFMLGAIFAFTAQHDMAGRLFEFVIAHGVVEISIILLSGALGLSLGGALVNPGIHTRRFAFERAARTAAAVLFVCIVFLIGAGLIEGYISPNPAFPLWSRIAIGLGYMCLFVGVVSGAVFRLPWSRPTAAASPSDP